MLYTVKKDQNGLGESTFKGIIRKIKSPTLASYQGPVTTAESVADKERLGTTLISNLHDLFA